MILSGGDSLSPFCDIASTAVFDFNPECQPFYCMIGHEDNMIISYQCKKVSSLHAFVHTFEETFRTNDENMMERTSERVDRMQQQQQSCSHKVGLPQRGGRKDTDKGSAVMALSSSLPNSSISRHRQGRPYPRRDMRHTGDSRIACKP